MPPTESFPGDRFVLLEKFGEGGAAVVWRARDSELRKLVAIKILCSSDPDLRDRFAQEVEVLANLDHAHVNHAVARGQLPRDQRAGELMEA